MEILKKYGIWIVASVAVIYVLVRYGGSNSSGVSFASPNPSSVAAVEQGNTDQITANNNLILGRAQIGTDFLSHLFDTQAAITINGQNTTRDMVDTKYSTDAGIAIAKFNAQANTRIASINAQANQNINSQNQGTARQAQTQGFISSLLGAIGNLFSGAV